MKKNIYLAIIGVLVVGLAIGLPFTFTKWNELIVANNEVLVLYIVSKAIFGLILIFGFVWSLVKERARGSVYMLLAASIIVQAEPILIRTSVYVNGFVLGFAILTLAVFLIAYVAFVGLLFTSNKKQLASDTKYQGSEIEVVDEKVAENRNKEGN